MNMRPGIYGSSGASGASRPLDARTAAGPPPVPPADALHIEVAWEVCNQLGGIYQVIKSKAPRMVARWGERFVMVGPWNPAKAALELDETDPTPGSWMARVIEDLRGHGVESHAGCWLIPGRPRVLLLEHERLGESVDQLNALKYRLWQDHGCEFPPSDALIDGVVTFAEAVRRLMWAVVAAWGKGGEGVGAGETALGPAGPTVNGETPAHHKHSRKAATYPAPGPRPPAPSRIITHYHEWMGGLAIPMLRHEHCPISTVFTTHATQLGRALAWGDEWFYDHLPFLDQAKEAARVNLKTQHGVERACAQNAHVFTTVSGITGEECTYLLGRSPDLITPNGLNIEHYNVGHEFQTLHSTFKERIHRFVMGHFFPSYSFDLDKTIYAFTAGRFEPRNKGFDLCIEAMARLNAELKAARARGDPAGDKTLVFFIITQRPTRSLHPQALAQRGVLNELEQVCASIMQDVNEKLFRKAAASQLGDSINIDDLVSEYWALRYRRTQHALKTDRLPMVVTHLLEDDAHDDVLNQIRNVWLFNKPDDPVKVVYHPEFINPTNPLWGIEYEQFVRGCHLGVFPSSYEPWGYTPLECLAMGVPAVTSDQAGFGRYIEDTMPEIATGFSGREQEGGGGLVVLKRRGRTFNEAAADLAQHLLTFCTLDRRDRINLRNQVERRSWTFDWGELGQAYDWAHDLAMARASAELRAESST